MTPYTIDPINQIGNYKLHWVGVIGPTQSGKSVVLQVAVADMIDQDPGPGLYVLPDETTGKKHLDEKVISMINASPELAQYKTNKIRDISYEKVQLQHMTIYPAWAGSIQTMNSFPMKRVFLDEVRLMGLTIGNESNAIKLAGDRLTTYTGYGIGQGYMVSSPSTEGDLLHQQLSIPGTLYVSWQVPCPVCGEFQELDFFENLKVEKGKAVCRCKYCEDGIFTDVDRKRSFNAKGKYAVVKYEDNQRITTKIYKDGTRDVPFEYGVGHNRVFFHWSSMDSPFRSFQQIWNEFQQTKDKIHDYKNFWQCWLARFWIEDKSKTTSISLRNQRKNYRKGTVPSGVKILTAGVDTQDKGFYAIIRGFGANSFTALVDEFFIPCAMAVATEQEMTDKLKDLIFNRVIDNWKVSIGAIDTGGHRTKALYKVCANIPRLIMCKGATDNQNVTIMYNKDINLYLVRTCEYLSETDELSINPNFWLPENVSKDYISQFVNRRKTEPLKSNKTGEYQVIWKRMGQDDFRYAEVHSFICLDIPTDKWGNLRQQLDVDGFIHNPYMDELAAQKQLTEKVIPISRAYEEEEEDFVQDVNW